MNHSFNVEVAREYNVEKAVVLNNLYFWCEENRANNRNIYKGRAYSYNTSEALAELFPYFKPRKIAELLRQLEVDGLIISAQVHGTNRVKSYALTDKALEFYTSTHSLLNEANTTDDKALAQSQKNVCSNIQNSVNGTYRNTTMEHTEFKHCTITDINNTDINTDTGDIAPDNTVGSKRAPKRFIKPSLQEVQDYIAEKSLNVDAQRFIDYYKSNGWKVGKNSMEDWQATVRGWASRNNERTGRGTLWGSENDCANKYDWSE